MENKELNLCEILKDCPKGTKLYSPIYGFMKLHSVKDESYSYPIFMADAEGCLHTFHPDGTMFLNTQAECCLFPSKEQRDWSKFKVHVKMFNPKEFKPFDKVLLRDRGNFKWLPSFFEKIVQEPSGEISVVELISRNRWEMCIPYNDETKSLTGTTDDCPEYYKWWEE